VSMCLAIPGRIVTVVDESERLARVDVAGVHRNVNIGLLDYQQELEDLKASVIE